MAKLKLKLKQSSDKEFLVTDSGYSITKYDFTIVDDDDKDISYYLKVRNDLMFSTVNDIELKTTDESNVKDDTFIEKIEKPKKQKEIKKDTEPEKPEVKEGIKDGENNKTVRTITKQTKKPKKQKRTKKVSNSFEQE